jgi:hypothetical protein
MPIYNYKNHHFSYPYDDEKGTSVVAPYNISCNQILDIGILGKYVPHLKMLDCSTI